MASVYASTSYLKRRELWTNLSSLKHFSDKPWVFIEDYNTILGAHEHRGSSNPFRTPIEDFQNWTDSNDSVHLPTRGAEFTWYNGRRGVQLIERRLDRVICDQNWINLNNNFSCSTIIIHKSYHHPLLLDFHFQQVKVNSTF